MSRGLGDVYKRQLQKDVVFVGVGSRIEIWSKESWNDSISNYDDNMDEVAENMDSLGFTI